LEQARDLLPVVEKALMVTGGVEALTMADADLLTKQVATFSMDRSWAHVCRADLEAEDDV
jgi:hypothetical protein